MIDIYAAPLFYWLLCALAIFLGGIIVGAIFLRNSWRPEGKE